MPLSLHPNALVRIALARPCAWLPEPPTTIIYNFEVLYNEIAISLTSANPIGRDTHEKYNIHLICPKTYPIT